MSRETDLKRKNLRTVMYLLITAVVLYLMVILK